ncbi:hypothetical protein [Streptomyces sp. FL07-04A]|uniref:hypothetical protein n=1 Tax=Streptomyces sp. FL07-04A TaxID=3028658 RepID=UPI0029B9BABD|nr:hypothetical protein [Streptomyces sp. FL07-04A]MDX3575458.1 hypothetical protein [Streptomyces sp. FL07-04A]
MASPKAGEAFVVSAKAGGAIFAACGKASAGACVAPRGAGLAFGVSRPAAVGVETAARPPSGASA